MKLTFLDNISVNKNGNAIIINDHYVKSHYLQIFFNTFRF